MLATATGTGGGGEGTTLSMPCQTAGSFPKCRGHGSMVAAPVYFSTENAGIMMKTSCSFHKVPVHSLAELLVMAVGETLVLVGHDHDTMVSL